MRRLIAVAALCAGCHRNTGPLQIMNEAADVASSPSWTHDDPSIIDARTLTAVSIALEQWHGTWDLLDGWTIVYAPNYLSKDATGQVDGLTVFDDQTISLNAWGGFGQCLEVTALAHEIGHVVLGGDGLHTDLRWHNAHFWQDLGERLAAATPPDDTECQRFLRAVAMNGGYPPERGP